MDSDSKSDSEEADLHEFDDESSDDVQIRERSFSSEGRSSRGRPRIPECWTRVISFSHDNLDKVKIFPIATDLLISSNLPTGTTPKKSKVWKPHFFSQTFLRDHKDI